MNLLLAGLAAAAMAAASQGQAGAAPETAVQSIAAAPAVAAAPGPVLRAGTPVLMVTTSPISSRRARQGQRFDLAVAEDVLVDGMVVIPRGSRGVGDVARVVEKGMFGKAGKLEVRVLFVEVGGRRIRLDGRATDKGKSGLGPTAAAVVLVGVWGGFVTGKSAVIPAGSTLTGHVYEDLPLKRAGSG